MSGKLIQCAVMLAMASLHLSVCSGDEGRVVSIAIQADKPGARINPAMWGIFFEDINFGADGGLYAELVKNRSFEFPDPIMGWSKSSPADTADIRDDDPFDAANLHYLRIRTGGISNEGFRGMGIRAGEDYVFSAQARAVEGQPTLRISLIAPDGRTLAETKLSGFDKQWKKCTATLHATQTEAKARLNICLDGPGAVDIDMVSLFPAKTWKNHPGGLRSDLVQMLADLKPGFIKFPGGFLTEGRTLDTRYQWKVTVGDIAERKIRKSVWSGIPARPAPDYFQSYGLGFFEYFQLCEDLGAEPQPMLNCGTAYRETAPLDQLDSYVQDTIDLVEFAKGSVTSPWGKKRAEMGHPKPFNLKMIRIGNEAVGPQYVERFERIAAAMKAKYPEIQLIAGTGPDPAGVNFDMAWDRLGHGKADILDEHSHNQPPWFFSNAGRFDRYDRGRSKVMIGEYCAHSEPGLFNVNNRSTLATALSEAAFMTGLERNADVVAMSSICAFLAHIDAWQWKPNLIWFDNLRVYGTPSYYVQQLFSRNRGDVVLPVSPAEPLYAGAARDNATGEVILKVVNPTAEPSNADVKLDGVARVAGPATAIVLTSGNPADENSFEDPVKVAPKTTSFTPDGPRFRYTFAANSLTVLRIKMEKE
jgi:alpha-L-arabinofuranosidase